MQVVAKAAVTVIIFCLSCGTFPAILILLTGIVTGILVPLFVPDTISGYFKTSTRDAIDLSKKANKS